MASNDLLMRGFYDGKRHDHYEQKGDAGAQFR